MRAKNTLDLLVLGERDHVLGGIYDPGEQLRSAVFDFEIEVAELFGSDRLG